MYAGFDSLHSRRPEIAAAILGGCVKTFVTFAATPSGIAAKTHPPCSFEQGGCNW